VYANNNVSTTSAVSIAFFEQELYRYAGDTNTSYYKAVKGWQDASKMKNEVSGDPDNFELRRPCLLSISKFAAYSVSHPEEGVFLD